MANKYYVPGEARAARVNDLFTAIAPRYDLINDFQSFGLHRLWKRRVVRLADPQPGERALDLCCGTGDLAFGLARRGARVIGLDFSERMLAQAKFKVPKVSGQSSVVRGPLSVVGGASPPIGYNSHPEPLIDNPQLTTDDGQLTTDSGQRTTDIGQRTTDNEPQTNPHFLCGDAQHLPFPDDQFDIVTVGYGLRNLSRWEAGLEEMARVARPGGRLLVLDFGKPDNPFWRRLYFAYLRWMVPWFGRIFCGDAQAYAYIRESLLAYPAQRGVAAKMEAMRCRDVRIFNLLGGVMSINYARK